MANKNNKYKVYRKYTTDDNGISWVETDEYRIVLVEENSKDCITETPTNTRWVETTGFICANKNKYAKEIKQISTDGGKTWTDTGEYRQGKLIEENSKDCGYTEVQYRWVVVNDPTKYVCVGTEKHKMEIRQLSNDGGITWVNVSPEETRASDEIIERNSLDCGGTAIYYKWVDTGFECGSNISSDATIVDEAPGELTKEKVYRWVVAEGADDYICDGKTKYYLYVKQQSTDGGLTWSEVQPRETQKGSVMDNNSVDCATGDTGTTTGSTTGKCETVVIYNDGTTKELNINGRLYDGSIGDKLLATNVEIGTCVTTIGEDAFHYCSNLTSITLSDSVISIEKYAFIGCAGLTSFTIPESVTEIGDDAFHYCYGLKSIIIPDSITSIRSGTFASCSGLISASIGSGVTSIGSYSFQACSGLTSFSIGSGVTSIGIYALSNCLSLQTLNFKGTTSQWKKITKGNYWRSGSPIEVIHCSDGDISL